MELLRFVFIGPGHFLGTLLLLMIVGDVLRDVVRAARRAPDCTRRHVDDTEENLDV